MCLGGKAGCVEVSPEAGRNGIRASVERHVEE